jgi:hypothetical protein
LASPFKSTSRLEAENAALRHQLIALRRKVRGRVEFTNGDRLFFILLYRWFPSILKAITIIRPETLVRWHRAGFRRYWRWKSRNPGGRPPIHAEVRALIRRMSIENVLWGAPRIQGELFKLGFAIAQSTVAKYMAQKRGPSWSELGHLPSQPCATHRRDGSVRGSDHQFYPAAALRENDLANRRPPMLPLITTLGGTIVAVCSRCQSQLITNSPWTSSPGMRSAEREQHPRARCGRQAKPRGHEAFGSVILYVRKVVRFPLRIAVTIGLRLPTAGGRFRGLALRAS